MKLYNIPSAGKFLRKIAACKGEARCVQPDGKVTDLKAMSQFLIRSGMADQLDGIREIDVRLEDQSDAVMLMRYAAQMNCQGRVA